MFELMQIPFIACLVLLAILTYLGIHIIQRQVIFVDLALAQIAALGAMTAIVLGSRLYSAGSYALSLLFTLAGAGIFALTRLEGRRVPQEAVIGIVYVVATACSIILLNSSPAEAEHIKHMLVGNVLFVSGQDVLRLCLICGAVGLFHFAFRGRFLAISCGSKTTAPKSSFLRSWDFLFYSSLGLVVAASVEAVGVLLIFSYLVIPAACAMLFSSRLCVQLVAAWAIGVVASVVGFLCSATFDLPTGAAIICALGAFFVVTMIGVAVTPGLTVRGARTPE